MILELSRVKNDDQASVESYYRIKIFTEEGKKRADVEIPFWKMLGKDITGIKARTIRPDGSIVPFNGKIYEKTIVKGRDLKYLAKTFTLPEVQPGSIIEYKYREIWDSGYLWDSSWTLQEDLFIKHAYYKIVPSSRSIYGTLWQTMRVPKGDQVKKLNIGYSDDVSVFLNGQILFRGRSAQNFRDPGFLGIVNPENDAVYLPLKKGGNELMLAVSELGGGWGFICRLVDVGD